MEKEGGLAPLLPTLPLPLLREGGRGMGYIIGALPLVVSSQVLM
jgi:hypothetical protein